MKEKSCSESNEAVEKLDTNEGLQGNTLISEGAGICYCCTYIMHLKCTTLECTVNSTVNASHQNHEIFISRYSVLYSVSICISTGA